MQCLLPFKSPFQLARFQGKHFGHATVAARGHVEAFDILLPVPVIEPTKIFVGVLKREKKI